MVLRLLIDLIFRFLGKPNKKMTILYKIFCLVLREF